MIKHLLSCAALVFLISSPAFAQEAELQAPPDTNIVVLPQAVPAADPADAAIPAATQSADGSIVAAIPPPAEPDVPMTPIEKEINEQLSYINPQVNLENMPSLFFSIWEHDLVRDARRGLNTRDNIDDGLDITGPRDISLGGIVYASKKDWTIWLNNVRISPNRIPTEVMDLKVFRDYIELEWFDKSTNQIFPIRLRPQQRFNLDSRIFLPG